jgi:phospholipid/cholesterol/gamma-HCH transport system ATP-binding protein
MSDSSLIVVNRLNSYYGKRRVLHDICCEVPRNKITVVMGVSGCGKSTLMRHLIGLKETAPGEILVEGKDLGRFGETDMNNYRRRMGVLFQSGALFNSLTVAKNIAVPLKEHTKLADETIDIIVAMKLHMVGLTSTGRYMPSQLSGGMRKRAGLARAIVMDPEILFVDEPSSGLDPITAAGLDELVLALKETLGMTIVVVTHELESAFRIADQVIVMDAGKVLAAGAPGDVRQSGDERVVQFLGRRPDEEKADKDLYIASLLGRRQPKRQAPGD